MSRVVTVSIKSEKQIVALVAQQQFEGNFSLALRHIIRDYARRHGILPEGNDQAQPERQPEPAR